MSKHKRPALPPRAAPRPLGTGTPGPAQALAHAFAARQRGNLAEAARLCRDVLAADAGHGDALHLMGVVALEAGRPQEASEWLARATTANPRHAEAFNNRGAALRALGHPAEALACFERAVALRPEFANAHYNRGNALGELARHGEALQSYERALTLKPDYAAAWYNRGIALSELRRHREAIASYRQAIALRPDDAKAHLNLAMCHLLLGEFAQGWPEHEWRWREEQRAAHRRSLAQPLWLGRESLEGRTILLHCEQGLGDTLQFCRYVARVAALAARVVLEVQPELVALLGDLEGAATVVAAGSELPAFDCHCPLMSLPLAFRTEVSSIPADVPYIRADERKLAHWRERLGAKTRPRVGLAWSGSPTHRNDRNRSIPLATLHPLLGDRVEWIGLQTEVAPADAALLEAGAGIRHFGAGIRDFTDTAALVALLDLVVSVDTSVAHLAGAMGKPVWIMLPFAPEWRWMQERTDSPWYPTARLFRQPAPGDWASVIARIR